MGGSRSHGPSHGHGPPMATSVPWPCTSHPWPCPSHAHVRPIATYIPWPRTSHDLVPPTALSISWPHPSHGLVPPMATHIPPMALSISWPHPSHGHIHPMALSISLPWPSHGHVCPMATHVPPTAPSIPRPRPSHGHICPMAMANPTATPSPTAMPGPTAASIPRPLTLHGLQPHIGAGEEAVDERRLPALAAAQDALGGGQRGHQHGRGHADTGQGHQDTVPTRRISGTERPRVHSWLFTKASAGRSGVRLCPDTPGTPSPPAPGGGARPPPALRQCRRQLPAWAATSCHQATAPHRARWGRREGCDVARTWLWHHGTCPALLATGTRMQWTRGCGGHEDRPRGTRMQGGAIGARLQRGTRTWHKDVAQHRDVMGTGARWHHNTGGTRMWHSTGLSGHEDTMGTGLQRGTGTWHSTGT